MPGTVAPCAVFAPRTVVLCICVRGGWETETRGGMGGGRAGGGTGCP